MVIRGLGTIWCQLCTFSGNDSVDLKPDQETRVSSPKFEVAQAQALGEQSSGSSLRNLNSLRLARVIVVTGIRFALQRDKELKPQEFTNVKSCGLVLSGARVSDFSPCVSAAGPSKGANPSELKGA